MNIKIRQIRICKDLFCSKLYCTVLCRWQLCDRLNLLCNQVNVIHTANPMDHANNAMVQPQFINQVQHASVDLSGHNLVNTHQASGIPSPLPPLIHLFSFSWR